MVKKRMFRLLAAALAIALAVVPAGCTGGGEQTVGQATALPSPGGTDAPADTPAPPDNAPEDVPPSTPLPEDMLLEESNIYVNGVYISQTAYLSAVTGDMMLPLKSLCAALNVSYSFASGAITMPPAEGGVVLVLTTGEDCTLTRYALDANGLPDEAGASRLSALGEVYTEKLNSAIYVPVQVLAAIVEQFAVFGMNQNSAGDVMVFTAPLPTPSPTPEETPESPATGEHTEAQ